ncbi:hypothetical protein [Sulfurimonas sp.]|uniref:hypothetical protein n=1 Tax=Sulfurimonas sp. TaxID=2022749 RepID=UPI00260D9832|nr:hypothetical protein [Sulfurimonas sp.]
MILNKQAMQQALKRIDELQNDIVEKSKNIEGADEYIQEKMKLFKLNEEKRQELKILQMQEEQLTEQFLASS